MERNFQNAQLALTNHQEPSRRLLSLDLPEQRLSLVRIDYASASSASWEIGN